MKQILATLWILLVLLPLVSCARDASDEPAPHPGVNPYLSVRHSISLDVEPLLPESALRAMGLEYDERLRAVTFDLSGSGPRLSSSTDSWKTYLFFRKKGDDAHVGYAEYEFVQGGRVSYVEGGVTKSKLVLKPKDLTTTLVGVPAEPALGEEWYISGITGGGALDPLTMQVSFANNYSVAQPLTTLNVPFSFDWTPLTIEQRGTLVLGVAKPTFKPQGVLMQVSVKNTLTATSSTFSQLALDPSNVPMSEQGYFDFSASRYTGADVASGASLHWESTHSASALEYRMDYTPSWLPSEQRVFMFWGMPLSGSPKTGLVFSGYDHLLRTYNVSSQQYGSVLSEKVLTSGKSYRLHVEIRRPKLPIEYVAERNIAGGVGRVSNWAGIPGTLGALRFATSNDIGESGFYNLTEVVPALFSPFLTAVDATALNPNGIDIMDMPIDGRKLKEDYFVPSLLNWMAVFPFVRIDNGAFYTTSQLSIIEYTLLGEDGAMGKIRSGADLAVSGGVLYGLRFRPVKATDQLNAYSYLSPTGWPSDYYTPSGTLVDLTDASAFSDLQGYGLYCAYRYRLVGQAIVVDVVYLGNSGKDVAIGEISTDQWWDDRQASWITRVLPLPGEVRDFNSYPNAPEKIGDRARYVSYMAYNILSHVNESIACFSISKGPVAYGYLTGYYTDGTGAGDYWYYSQYETLRLFTKE